MMEKMREKKSHMCSLEKSASFQLKRLDKALSLEYVTYKKQVNIV
jgi:hypothetical protein